jgi:type IVB pilus formation R64 PilN family outer membrane protein
MKKQRLTRFIIYICTTLMLSACALPPYQHADERVDQTDRQIAADKAADNERAAPVISRPGYYIDTHPVTLSQDPAWMRRTVTMAAQNMPLDELVSRLLRNSDANVRYDETVSSKRLVSLHYTGTVKGALDTVAAKTRYYYVVEGNVVSWSAFQTKMFDISFMPGYSSYLVGRGQNSSSGFGNAYLGQGEVQSDVNDDQYSSLQAQLSVWEDLRNGIGKLISPEGKFMISEATTTVTVRDHPDNIDSVGKYLGDLNHELSQQVAIRVEVLDVELNQTFNMGINWDAVVTTMNTMFQLTGSLSNATTVPQTILSEGSSSPVSSFIIGKNSQQTFINALDLQGKVHVVTNPQVVTMNNQMASIRITNDTSYVKSTTTTQTPDAGTASSIVPGTITDGFTLYVLPKIQGDKVFMQITSTLSDLTGITKADNIPVGVNPNNDNTQNNFTAIQIPALTQKMFNQRTALRSGETLIVAGYRRVRDETSQAKFFEIAELGGKGSDSQNIETLVLITPIIMKDTDQ